MNPEEPLIFERSAAGKIGMKVEEAGLPDLPLHDLLPSRFLRDDLPRFPEVSEVDVVRHFTRLARLNYAVDLGLYPLGSCTMKYNPKVNEKLARLPGFAALHPNVPEGDVQGILTLMAELEEMLMAITGLDGFTLQPAAGAHGELTGMMIIRKAHERAGNPRKVVLIPDSAHGTNPASATFAGYTVKELKSNARGTLDLDVLASVVDEDVAALMLTVPNTLGVFEDGIVEIARILHEKGAYLYCDGANFNAFMGVVRPGDMGVDVLHLNLHKTFSTPHGGGGPGAGPVGVVQDLVPYLPVPRVVREGKMCRLKDDYPHAIGRVRAFYGNVGVLIRAYAYILSLGSDGIREAARRAVLNANYIRAKLKGHYHLEYDAPTLHEVVFDDQGLKDYGVTNGDVAKRLLDYGFHPPTVSFPLIVHGALMIEPTETEERGELDRFIEAMIRIAEEARENPDLLHEAPHDTPLRRLDEVAAARNPVLTYEE